MEKLNIFQRINHVMQDVSYIQRGEKRVANQYRYVSHDQVSSVFHEALTKHGIVMLPNVTSFKQDGNRTEVTIDISFVNIDEPTDLVKVTYFGYGIDTGDKGPGKAISYAVKYALLKTFCLETGDDPDHDQKVVHEPANAKLEPSMIEMIDEDKLMVSFLEKYPDYEPELIKGFLDKSAAHFKKSIKETILDCKADARGFEKTFYLWRKKEVERNQKEKLKTQSKEEAA
jgi:hypothetical protein